MIEQPKPYPNLMVVVTVRGQNKSINLQNITKNHLALPGDPPGVLDDFHKVVGQ